MILIHIVDLTRITDKHSSNQYLSTSNHLAHSIRADLAFIHI
jgi:hypothetical protein